MPITNTPQVRVGDSSLGSRIRAFRPAASRTRASRGGADGPVGKVAERRRDRRDRPGAGQVRERDAQRDLAARDAQDAGDGSDCAGPGERLAGIRQGGPDRGVVTDRETRYREARMPSIDIRKERDYCRSMRAGAARSDCRASGSQPAALRPPVPPRQLPTIAPDCAPACPGRPALAVRSGGGTDFRSPVVHFVCRLPGLHDPRRRPAPVRRRSAGTSGVTPLVFP